MADKSIENMKVPKHEHEHECPKCGSKWPCIMSKKFDGVCRREKDGELLCWPCEKQAIAEIEMAGKAFKGNEKETKA